MKQIILFAGIVSAGFLAFAAPREGIVPEMKDFRAPVREIREFVPGFLWVEAENFSDYGEWRLDTQFVHKMGSAYLLAAGVGEPIADATTRIRIPASGTWRVWVRSKDWLPEFSPGTFTVALNGKRSPKKFGASKKDWGWENAGDFVLNEGECTLALCDLSGAFARCDAILLTHELAYVPAADFAANEAERQRLSGLPKTIEDGGSFDVIVVGAGCAGMGAAVAAARTGAKTALVQDRPVLGGNASVECGIGTDGASVSHRNARETGLNEEANLLRLRAPEPKTLSHAYRLQAEGEKNLAVFYNQRVMAAEKGEDGAIRAVVATDTLTLRKTRFRAKMFIDCTGDGWVGYFAGAKYRFGREGKDEFQEEIAPEKPDLKTMSGCIMGDACIGYRVVDKKKPAPYQTPAWADILPPGFIRHIRGFHGGQWWMEHPGTFDDLEDPERARDELIRISFAYWGWIKNGWERKAEAANFALSFVPYNDARRETRRLIGDYILTANDVQSATMFPDRISYGGWPIDTHDPEGIQNPTGNGYYSKHPPAPIYSIPYRVLYSVNVPNLFFAGRCQSVTHMALGTVRVQATLATLGQAAGTAAALALRHGVSPREYGKKYIGELQQQLLKDDQYIPQLKNEDPADLARAATVTASSTLRNPQYGRREARISSKPEGIHPLNMPRAVCIPFGQNKRLETLNLYLISHADTPVELAVKLYGTATAKDLNGEKRELATIRATIPAKQSGYVPFPVRQEFDTPFLWVVLPPHKSLEWALLKTPVENGFRAWGGKQWTVVGNQQYAFFTDPPLNLPVFYKPENVIDGVTRRTAGETHLWVSEIGKPLPQWIELDFGKVVEAREVRLTFDTNLTPTRTPGPMPRELVRAYTVEGWNGTSWKTLAREEDNGLRLRSHLFEPQKISKLRVNVTKTHGDPSARIFEIRVY
ncbi:MAG: FAD-dependent oxidoreductase [Kiritimatiellae bacterium]|nr:FAD-dependent oxidoreductase [Kiritimatiellia bacterium]